MLVEELARQQGISLSELCRRGLAEMIARSTSEMPWMAFAGVLPGMPYDSSAVDQVV